MNKKQKAIYEGAMIVIAHTPNLSQEEILKKIEWVYDSVINGWNQTPVFQCDERMKEILRQIDERKIDLSYMRAVEESMEPVGYARRHIEVSKPPNSDSLECQKVIHSMRPAKQMKVAESVDSSVKYIFVNVGSRQYFLSVDEFNKMDIKDKHKYLILRNNGVFRTTNEIPFSSDPVDPFACNIFISM